MVISQVLIHQNVTFELLRNRWISQWKVSALMSPDVLWTLEIFCITKSNGVTPRCTLKLSGEHVLGLWGLIASFFTTYFMVVEGSIMETTIVTLVLFLDGPESLVHCCDHPKFWVNLPKGSWKNCHGMRPLLTHNFRGSTSITSWMAEDGNWGFWSHTSLLMGAHWNTWKSLRKFIWAWFHPQFCYSKIVASRLPIAQPHHQNPYVGVGAPLVNTGISKYIYPILGYNML